MSGYLTEAIRQPLAGLSLLHSVDNICILCIMIHKPSIHFLFVLGPVVIQRGAPHEALGGSWEIGDNEVQISAMGVWATCLYNLLVLEPASAQFHTYHFLLIMEFGGTSWFYESVNQIIPSSLRSAEEIPFHLVSHHQVFTSYRNTI